MKKELQNNAWKVINNDNLMEVNRLAGSYINFLNTVKTEREAVDFVESAARKKGFQALDEAQSISPGSKLYIKSRGKAIGLIIVGQEPVEKGMNLVASHIDAPRVDLKARPLYEADSLALFKTHYYGGIKKYQWVAIPLAMHGVVIKKDGTQININIGEKPEDLVFTITDLLPHLAKDQMEKKMSEGIGGENLNILAGSIPAEAEDEPLREKVLEILKESYHIEEEDFCSAEIEMVPAFKAREVGFDRSLIGGYGQDDRVCAYTSLQAILETENPQRTVVCIFADKEEIGSTGNTGLQSLLMEDIFTELLYREGKKDYYTLRKSMHNSFALSADVNAAVDPNYPEVFEKMNCSFLSGGVVLTKYTGSKGKSDSNDANPEFLAKIRALLDGNQVKWQVGELGKVDIGGGGTVAKYMSYFGMEVLDCGAAVLGMHSPYEIVSKADVYMTYKAYKVFLADFK